MDRIDYAKKLSDLIVSFSDRSIPADRADLIAFRYVANNPKKHWWEPNHTSISQLANNIVLVEQMKSEKRNTNNGALV